MPNDTTRGLPDDYREQTEILLKLPTKMATAVHRDPTKRPINRYRNPHMQSGFQRAEAHSYHGEYDHPV